MGNEVELISSRENHIPCVLPGECMCIIKIIFLYMLLSYPSPTFLKDFGFAMFVENGTRYRPEVRLGSVQFSRNVINHPKETPSC